MLYKLNTMLLLVSLATNVEAVVGGTIVVMKPPSNYSNNSTCLKFDILRCVSEASLSWLGATESLLRSLSLTACSRICPITCLP